MEQLRHQPKIMYSGEDIERLYFQHKSEAFLHGESFQSSLVSTSGCMPHANNKFVKAGNQGDEPATECLSNLLKRFFKKNISMMKPGLLQKRGFKKGKV